MGREGDVGIVVGRDGPRVWDRRRSPSLSPPFPLSGVTGGLGALDGGMGSTLDCLCR